MGTDYVPLICYYDGQVQPGTSDPIYVGGYIKADQVRKNISFKEFVIKMHELCKSPPGEATIDIKCRYLLDQRKSIAMQVEDDNSLSIIMDLHPHQCNAITVYIEKRSAQTSSTTNGRNEKASSSSGSGDWNHVENTQVGVVVDQLTNNGSGNIDSVVVGMHSNRTRNIKKNKQIIRPSKESSSLSRYKLELEKEVEMSLGSTYYPAKTTFPTSLSRSNLPDSSLSIYFTYFYALIIVKFWKHKIATTLRPV